MCECGDRSCRQPLRLTLGEYEGVRAHPARFAVLPKHVFEEVECVVDKLEGYWLVEKFGAGGEHARQTDPRHSLKTCRVVVVDDVAEVRILVKMLLQLEPTCTVVGEGGNGRQAVTLAHECKPEVLILDLEMPVMGGEAALPEILRASPTTKVIVFSGSAIADPGMEKRMLNLGAHLIVPKGGDPALLIDAIRTVATSGRERSAHLDTPSDEQ